MKGIASQRGFDQAATRKDSDIMRVWCFSDGESSVTTPYGVPAGALGQGGGSRCYASG
jgi:hypothetical protein